jgi:hypothetical protein
MIEMKITLPWIICGFSADNLLSFPYLLLDIIMIGKVVPVCLKIVKIQQKIVSKMLKSLK